MSEKILWDFADITLKRELARACGDQSKFRQIEPIYQNKRSELVKGLTAEQITDLDAKIATVIAEIQLEVKRKKLVDSVREINNRATEHAATCLEIPRNSPDGAKDFVQSLVDELKSNSGFGNFRLLLSGPYGRSRDDEELGSYYKYNLVLIADDLLAQSNSFAKGDEKPPFPISINYLTANEFTALESRYGQTKELFPCKECNCEYKLGRGF